MFANGNAVEQACQGSTSGIELAQAIDAAVRDSLLRSGSKNRAFFEGLAAVKASNSLYRFRVDYIQRCDELEQETVRDVTKPSDETAVDFLPSFFKYWMMRYRAAALR